MTLLLASLVASSLACGYEGPDFIDVATPPTVADVTGTWDITAESLAYMEADGGYALSTHTLTLNGDGTFEYTNLPDWLFDSLGESHGELLSAAGTWALEPDSNGSSWRVKLDSASYSYWGLFVSQEGGRYLLYAFLGGTGNSIVFEN